MALFNEAKKPRPAGELNFRLSFSAGLAQSALELRTPGRAARRSVQHVPALANVK